MTDHEQKVNRIAGKLRERKSTSPLTLKKKTVAHQVPKLRDKRFTDEKLDVSDLNDIISIDPEKKICVAEPGVTFLDLAKATLRYGLVPMTVPEQKSITIGGAVAGCSIESMSYKSGGFHDSCLEYEVITAKGDVLTCTPESNGLIFQMMNGTFGTLGIISRLTFRLIPAKKFVRVVYQTYNSIPEYQAAIMDHYKKQDVDFMDGLIFSTEKCVLSIGTFMDRVPFVHSYEWTRSYYLSIVEGRDDYMTTIEYFFRYDKGFTYAFPKSFLGRLLIGKFVGSTVQLWLAEKLHKIIPQKMIPITVDLFIPFSKAPEFFEWFNREVGHYPLWCVPYKIVRKYEWLSDELFRLSGDELFLDIAIYGMTKRDKNYYRVIEEKLMEIGGLKTLISNNYYSEEEFWKTWNKGNYLKVKQQTDPDNILRSFYDKTCTAARGLDKQGQQGIMEKSR